VQGAARHIEGIGCGRAQWPKKGSGTSPVSGRASRMDPRAFPRSKIVASAADGQARDGTPNKGLKAQGLPIFNCIIPVQSRCRAR
jgi:hypothetical protein